MSPKADAPTREHGALSRVLRTITEAALLPIAGIALIGSTSAALPRRVFGTSEEFRPTRGRVIVHAIAGLLLGLVVWVLLALVVLTFARGALYGLFDPGPYDNSWGGPTLAGAWVAHFAISTVGQAVAVVAILGVMALHRRVSAPLRASKAPWWAWTVTIVLCAIVVLFLIAWSRQL